MLDVSIGSGIMWGSFFLALGAMGIVYLNGYFNTSKDKSGKDSSGRNGYIRKGEYDQAFHSLQERIENLKEENKSWWKQLDTKLDRQFSYLQEHIDNQDKRLNEVDKRIASVETVQELCNSKPAGKAAEGGQ